MGVHIGDDKLVITTIPINFQFDLTKDVDRKLKYRIDFIMKLCELLAEHITKPRLFNYCPN